MIARRRSQIVADMFEGIQTPVPWHPGLLTRAHALAWFERERLAGLSAGVAVDMREGTRMRDPKRVAVYFLKHSAPGDGSGSKEYQHRVPDLWMAVRWGRPILGLRGRRYGRSDSVCGRG